MEVTPSKKKKMKPKKHDSGSDDAEGEVEEDQADSMVKGEGLEEGAVEST